MKKQVKLKPPNVKNIVVRCTVHGQHSFKENFSPTFGWFFDMNWFDLNLWNKKRIVETFKVIKSDMGKQ